MGRIISSKKEGDQVISEISSDYEEFLQLRGHLENVRLFSENVAETKTNISQRGKNSATKYFLIPKNLRNGFKFNNTTSCQKLDFKDKVIFVYVINKQKTNPSKRETAIRKIEARYFQESPKSRRALGI